MACSCFDIPSLRALCGALDFSAPATDKILAQVQMLAPCEEILAPLSHALLNVQTAENAHKELAAFCSARDESGFAELAVMLCAALKARECYAARGIPDEIFLDTMACFPRFVGECHAREGKWFFDRGFWAWRQLTGVLLCLGTLEFEFLYLPEHRAAPLALPIGSPAISVHIPAGARCTPEALHTSYALCKRYFTPAYLRALGYDDAHGALENPPIYSATWLLSARVQALFPTGGLHQFAADYKIRTTDYLDNSARLWIFNAPQTPDSDLPEETSLQRAAKEILLRGETIGLGIGLLNSK